jgi:outer membrane protein OmpA-like peptidoglycan-associated protein
MRTAISLLSSLLFIWIAGSSYIYVCSIRQDCFKAKEATEEPVIVKEDPADTIKAEITVPQIPKPDSHTIFFDFNKKEVPVSSETSSYFGRVKKYLEANPGKKVLITGHSDSIGPDPAKEYMSLARANFIKNQMIEAGIESGAIEVKSESDRKPLADNSTREGRNKNRRAEIIIQ